MKKNFKFGKAVMAATVATSVFAVSNPADAANVSAAEKAVQAAEKLGGALKWEVSIEYRKTKYPTSLVGFPNMKLHNDTKSALAAAKKAVSTLKGKEKEVLQARLDANVTTYLNRSVAYIDAVSSGMKIQKKYQELKVKFDNAEVDSETEKLYHELSREIKKNAYMLDRVYGVTTREEFRSFYKRTAENQIKELLFPVSIKIEIDRAEKALKDSKLDLAATHLGNVDFFMKEAEKKGQKEDSKIIQGALAELEAVQKEFNKTAVLYVAGSTDAAAPTVFGPATGTDSVTKSVYLYAGNNEHIKLQNLNVDGNIVVLGTPSGAGTVYLENVKVNKVGTVGGSIIVENIADHSLHMKGVQADSIVVNDADGSNIVAGEGVKVKDVVVSDKAGAKGSVSLESKEKGSFGTITVDSKGNANSQGVALKGNLSETTVTVTGEGAKIGVEKGATVKEINIKAASTINVAEGSTVKEVKKDASVTGTVSVDNKGTVEKAAEGVIFPDKKPVVVVPTTPVTPPVSGGGGGSDTGTPQTVPVTNLYLLASDRDDRDAKAGIDLSSVSNDVKFEGLKIVGAPTGSELHVTKIGTSNTNFLRVGEELTITLTSSKEVKVGDFLEGLDSGDDGISLGNLRGLTSNKSIIIEGYVKASGYSNYLVNVSITLGGIGESSFENHYFRVTKDSDPTTHVATVTILNDATLGQLTTDGIDFASVIDAFISTNVSVTGGVSTTAEQIRVALRALDTLGTLESLKLSDLRNRTITYGQYTIRFV